MELRKHISFRNVFIFVYCLSVALYILIGLQPAKARDYVVSGTLSIPAISLNSDVTTLELKNRRLDTPDTIVGSYAVENNKTLLIGHSTTVFSDLPRVRLGDEIIYNDKVYRVDEMVVLAREDISMIDLLKHEERDTLVVMTCAGELLGEGEATHRLIITASVQ